MKYKRVCINISGYAIVPGDTDEKVMANVKNLRKQDCNWEDVNAEVLSNAKIVEDCGPNGES